MWRRGLTIALCGAALVVAGTMGAGEVAPDVLHKAAHAAPTPQQRDKIGHTTGHL